MGHPHIRIKGLHSTKEKHPDTDLEDKSKINLVFYITLETSATKEGNIYLYLCGRFPTTSSRVNKDIYVMYV